MGERTHLDLNDVDLQGHVVVLLISRPLMLSNSFWRNQSSVAKFTLLTYILAYWTLMSGW